MSKIVEKFKNLGTQHGLLLVGIVSVVIAFGLACTKYHQYAQAVIWHCEHGDYASIGAYRVKLPLLWWREDADVRNAFKLVRASPSSKFPGPEILVRPAYPGEVAGSGAEELQQTQAVISTLNHDPATGWSHSLMILTPRPFPLYCNSEHYSRFGLDLISMLTCHAATLPYAIISSGSSKNEKEAEHILLSLE